MRNRAAGAIFDPFFGVPVIASASFSKRVQRTVTEQAIKPFRISGFMAGEKLAFPVAKIFVLFHLIPVPAIDLAKSVNDDILT